MKWPIKYRIWRYLHGVANTLAWRYARPPGETKGIALRLDKNNPLWRLNDFFGDRYIPWYIDSIRSKHQ